MSNVYWAPLPALAVLVTVGVLAAPAPNAFARPEYAKKEGKACAYCHTNPKGGGPRNEKGNEYQKNKLKFLPEKQGFGEDGAFSTEATGKAFGLVRDAIGLAAWNEALTRLAALKSKEKKGTKGAELLASTETSVDARAKELLAAAKDAIQAGKASEAAEALQRVESEFKGRDAAKDVAKWRIELEKLAGGKEAEAVANLQEPQRLQWFAAQMKMQEGDKVTAIKLAEDLVTKFPEGPFTAAAKAKVAQWKAAPAAPVPAGMGG